MTKLCPSSCEFADLSATIARLNSELAQWQTDNANLQAENERLMRNGNQSIYWLGKYESEERDHSKTLARVIAAERRADEAEKKLRRVRLVAAQGEDY